MLARWWWTRSNRVRQMLSSMLQILSAGVFAVLFGLAVFEAAQDNPDTVRLNLLVLSFMAQLAGAGFALSRQRHLRWYWREFADLRHEFAGAVVLTGLLLFLVTIPAERKAEYQLKQQLIREMGGTDNGLTLRAVAELGARGWLTDGSLKGATLALANLQGANLGSTNLQETDLYGSNLAEANLAGINLQGATLVASELQRADLMGASLLRANLRLANLEGTYLVAAELQGADLWIANLKGAELSYAKFDEQTVLPDGAYWTPNTDLDRFTDPDHPNFWRGYEAHISRYDLARASFIQANLQGAMLDNANLRGALLGGADLQRATLLGANLQEASLAKANLQSTDLQLADLQNANLEKANLQNADLRGANLQGARLIGANLEMASLRHATFDETTVLPDGAVWTPGVDMTRFTNPDHPEFWRSDDPNSPAYRDNSH